jgi:hypothetical protein
LGLGRHVLPSKKESYEIRRRDRFDLLPHSPQGQAVNPGQEHSVTPFYFFSPRSGKFSTQDDAVALQGQQRGFDFCCRDAQSPGQLAGRRRSQRLDPAVNDSSRCFFLRSRDPDQPVRQMQFRIRNRLREHNAHQRETFGRYEGLLCLPRRIHGPVYPGRPSVIDQLSRQIGPFRLFSNR